MRRGLAVLLAAGISAVLIVLIMFFALTDDPLVDLQSILSHLVPK
jgi:hypothetical protein